MQDVLVIGSSTYQNSCVAHPHRRKRQRAGLDLPAQMEFKKTAITLKHTCESTFHYTENSADSNILVFWQLDWLDSKTTAAFFYISAILW